MSDGTDTGLYQECENTLGLDGFLPVDYIECIMRLSTLPLNQFNIDITLNDWWWYGAFEKPWTQDDRLKYADLLRRTLLNPERTEI